MENEDTKVNFFECTYICSTRFFRSQLLIFAHELTAVGFFLYRYREDGSWHKMKILC